MLRTNKAFALLILIVVGLALVGCGGGGSASSGGTETLSASGDKAGEADPGGGKSATPEEKGAADKGNPKKEKPPVFKAADGEEVKKFGSPAPPEETEAASAVLNESLKAREAGQWQVQCDSLTVATQEEITELAKAKKSAPCAESLEAIAKPLASTKAIREDTLNGQIEGLRVKGKTGYAFWKDAEGNEWAVAMKQEDGQWLVDSLTVTAIG